MTSDASFELISAENVLAAVFLILALVFPVLFHVVHLGSTFLPMFFPIALGGFFLSPVSAGSVGFLAPLISSLLTGMPPLYPPVAPLMALEGLILALSISWTYRTFKWNQYVSLALGIALQRVVMVVVILGIAPLFRLPGEIFSVAMLVTGIPGIILQLVAIPPLVTILESRVERIKEIS